MYHLKQIPTEAQIRKYFRRIVFGKNVFCPECRSRETIRYEDRYRCRSCRIKFSLLSHTWFSDAKLPYQSLWLILWCWTTQIPVRQAMALCRCSEEAIRRWFDRFRAHLPENDVILEKIIQLDEAYFRSMALLMGKQKGTRKLAWEALSRPTVERHHATFFLHQYVKPGSRLHTDGAAIYKTIDRWWPVIHATDIHKKFEFGKTSEIEGIFGNLRTFIRRMYHHATREKLPEMVSEFCYRFSSPELFENPRYYLEKTLRLCTN
jgi:transposase-like protein